MFSHLTDFAFKRAPLQALGFYVVYLLIVLTGTTFIGIATDASVARDSSEFGNGVRLGTFFAIAACATLSFFIIKAKSQKGTLGLTLLTAATAILALLGGGVTGLIIPAFLTTTGKTKSKKK